MTRTAPETFTPPQTVPSNEGGVRSARLVARRLLQRGWWRGIVEGPPPAAASSGCRPEGSTILKLLSGRYRVTVDDRTAKAGFTVQELSKPAVALTGVTFVGRRTVTVTFKTGRWMYYSPAGTKSYFTVVS